MKVVLFLVLLLIGFSGPAFSQTAETEDEEIQISICRPQITEAGRRSSFQFSYRYRVVTDEIGLVKEVKEITDNKRFRGLMDDEKIVPCIEKWKLKPSESYIVIINVGTTGIEKSLSISSKTVKIKFIL